MRRTAISFFLFGLALGAQAPRFDAVSIKPSPYQFGGAVSPMQAGRWRESSITLASLITFAYNLPGRGFNLQVEGGPADLRSAHFVIDATVSSAQVSTDEQRALVLGMLADRFHLVSHAATELMPAYALELAAGGAKLKAASAPCDANPPPGPPAQGAPPRCGSVTDLPGNIPDTTVLSCRSVSMQDLADWFLGPLTRMGDPHPVLDQTGLTGVYDFDLVIPMVRAPDGSSAMNDADSYRTNILSLEKALENQAGLRIDLLRPVKLPVKVIVIDSAEMPAN